MLPPDVGHNESCGWRSRMLCRPGLNCTNSRRLMNCRDSPMKLQPTANMKPVFSIKIFNFLLLSPFQHLMSI